MSFFKQTRTALVFVLMVVSVSSHLGCSPQQHLYLGGNAKGHVGSQYIDKGLRIDYADAEVPTSPEVCGAISPFTLQNPNPTSYWDLGLEESIQTALQNSKVIRSLNTVSFSKAGVAGVPGALLSNPLSVGTVYDPALVESDPRYGVEAALSVFDAQYNGYAGWTKNDQRLNRYGLPSSQTDTFQFNNTVQKTNITGATTYITNGNTYNWDNSPTGTGPTDKQWPSSWSTYIEAGITQPLLQGTGMQFNRIAGPGATPGFYNGALIARISADMSLADFEMNARSLVADVEKAYWNLYYAYHYLESVKAGRDSALQTWQQIHAMLIAGHSKGTAQAEAQSRQTYYSFRSQTELAQSNLFKSENTLRYIMGLAATDGRLIRPIDEPTVAPLQLDWDSVLCEALLRSPELRKQKWDVKSKELQLIAAKNFLLPRFDLIANYRWNGMGEYLIEPQGSRENAYGNLVGGDHADWTLGIQGSVPFGFRKELAGVRNAQLLLAKSRAILQEQELELSHQIADSFRELSQNYTQSRTQLNRRIASEAEVQAVRASYDAGTTTLDQVLEALRRLAEAETDYYRAMVDYNLSIMTLHYRKGSLLECNNVGLSEGPWPNKAYFDATKQARKRQAGHYMNYGFTRPNVVSRQQYRQFQNGSAYGWPEGRQAVPVAPGQEVIPPAPSIENRPMEAPRLPATTNSKVIETQSTQSTQPTIGAKIGATTGAKIGAVVPAVGSTAGNDVGVIPATARPVSYTAPQATGSNRYVRLASLPEL